MPDGMAQTMIENGTDFATVVAPLLKLPVEVKKTQQTGARFNKWMPVPTAATAIQRKTSMKLVVS